MSVGRYPLEGVKFALGLGYPPLGLLVMLGVGFMLTAPIP